MDEISAIGSIELSIVMPCLNESETIGCCIDKAKQWLEKTGVKGEIIIGDNGSTDGSQEIAMRYGARVVPIPQRGYGAALYGATLAVQGRYVIMGDSDDSYDFSDLSPFLEKLREGYDLVMGNRFMGGIQPGAMPWKNRYIGNPLLTGVGRILFNCPVSDFHCGLRGFSKAAFIRMELHTTGMEYASEMVIKAALLGMKITEVPTTLSKDGRSRPPHLRPWRDGWRHLRFMLLFSPRWLFIYPGSIVLILGLMLFFLLFQGPVRINDIQLDIHSMVFAGAMTLIGYMLLLFGFITRLIGINQGLLPPKHIFDYLRAKPVLEIGSLLGSLLIVIGLFYGVTAIIEWGSAHFGALDPMVTMRTVLLSVMSILFGFISLVFSIIFAFIVMPTNRVRSD
ncbi:MAG TPA: glycosyltransferase family 2 protein [Candidatus Competibacteraceae bacterium]|nr:glycosyltransferase family 2 protein [Candidatus Competibacteraceae bacterium]